MLRPALILAACLALVSGCGDEGRPAAAVGKAPISTPTPAPVSTAPCRPARVRQAPYPGHGKGLDTLPWIAGTPRGPGLVGLIWYFPTDRDNVHRARIWAGGKAPQGYNTKMLWVFLGDGAQDRASTALRVTGRRMDGPGRFADSFAAIGYEGSDGDPSYASIIDIPRPGCWRLTLTSGSLRASVDMRAIKR